MEDLTATEKGWVGIMRLLKLEKKREIRKKLNTKYVQVTFSWRSSKNMMGRFGAGWQWEFGFQANSRFTSIIINLFIFSLYFHFGRITTVSQTKRDTNK